MEVVLMSAGHPPFGGVLGWCVGCVVGVAQAQNHHPLPFSVSYGTHRWLFLTFLSPTNREPTYLSFFCFITPPLWQASLFSLVAEPAAGRLFRFTLFQHISTSRGSNG